MIAGLGKVLLFFGFFADRSAVQLSGCFWFGFGEFSSVRLAETRPRKQKARTSEKLFRGVCFQGGQILNLDWISFNFFTVHNLCYCRNT